MVSRLTMGITGVLIGPSDPQSRVYLVGGQ